MDEFDKMELLIDDDIFIPSEKKYTPSQLKWRDLESFIRANSQLFGSHITYTLEGLYRYKKEGRTVLEFKFDYNIR